MKKKRNFILLLCIALCVAMVFSYAFIARESDHDCIGEHCQICLELQTCRSILRNLFFAAATIAVVEFAVGFLPNAYGGSAGCPKAGTPILLKVKLLN